MITALQRVARAMQAKINAMRSPQMPLIAPTITPEPKQAVSPVQPIPKARKATKRKPKAKTRKS